MVYKSHRAEMDMGYNSQNVIDERLITYEANDNFASDYDQKFLRKNSKNIMKKKNLDLTS